MEEKIMADAVLTKVKIRPLGDRVLVKALEKEKQERGGLIIPDTAKEKPQEGEVIAAGKGKIADDGKLLPMDVKAGDKILYGKYSGTEIKIDGDEYLIMHQDDILGILESK
jgi:chaperonin GroES